jgi:hypothetical protein
MHRAHVVLLVALVLLGIVLGGSGALATAQDTDPATHPLVGSWIFDGDVEDPDNLPEMVTFFADGTAIFGSPDGPAAHGAWASTGDAQADVTFVFVFQKGYRVLLRLNVGVAEDGQAFVAFYTNEYFTASDVSSGEIGPRVAEGSRIGVAGPGTPVASYEEFPFDEFFGGTEQAPEATPVS